MNVMIGVDPHKASHTAVAIGNDEDEIASVKVRATLRQVDQLLSWAEPFEKRTWAIESTRWAAVRNCPMLRPTSATIAWAQTGLRRPSRVSPGR